jgi:hypothetical protein
MIAMKSPFAVPTPPNELAVVGENKNDPSQLLLLGADGHYYAYSLPDGDTKEVDPNDDWDVEFPATQELFSITPIDRSLQFLPYERTRSRDGWCFRTLEPSTVLPRRLVARCQIPGGKRCGFVAPLSCWQTSAPRDEKEGRGSGRTVQVETTLTHECSQPDL